MGSSGEMWKGSGDLAVFATTHWSVIAAASQADPAQAHRALEELCRACWYPVYAHLRGRGYQPADAEDLTQGLFLRLLQKDFPAGAHPHKGRFRSYLLGALNHFLADEHDRRNAQKRGRGQPGISFDAASAEERYRMEPADERTPDRLFDRRWALSLLDRVLERLRQEQRHAGQGEALEALFPFLVPGQGEQTYAEVGRRLGQTEPAVRKAVQRLRQRYGYLLRQEIARTVETASQVDEELRYLCERMAD